MMEIQVTKKQKCFLDATADEVLYGGAAGGGKSYGQTVDAMLFALKYPGSKQLILRRTFPELEKSLVRTALGLYPREIFTYNQSARTGRFANGSIIDFGYCDAESDVYRYQGAEYDCIRFDELTHFTEFQYLYLKSRLRGANPFPKQIKSTTNPGGVGHAFCRARFVDPAPANTPFEVARLGGVTETRLYIPATVRDNVFLMRSDPAYLRRLEDLPEKQRKALLDGNWNIFDGVRFTQFDEQIHVCEPFTVPATWRRYRTIDYGLDRLACLWAAVAPDGDIYLYREYCESGLIISDAARQILARSNMEEVYCTLAPDDLWSRGQESGKSRALLFADAGLPLVKVSRDRAAGWAAIDELLKVRENGQPRLGCSSPARTGPRLHIFRNCTELIRYLPQLQIDPQKPDDVLTEPHEITHINDSLRNLAVWFTAPARSTGETKWTDCMVDDYKQASPAERRKLVALWGTPKF